MAVQANLEVVEGQALKNLRSMIARGKSSRTFLQKHAYPAYLGAQRKRFQTENKSQSQQWAALNPKYAAYKVNKYASAPGGGRKIMIATGKLYKSIIGEGDGHFKLITDKEMVVGTSIPYATFPARTRSIMKFNPDFIRRLKEQWSQYLISGKTDE